ncbi:hypothetical protein J8273_6390 [Carpediemonas membranifera]|uniref:Uncharacterized protein n=1 Tax=Carpediemonas membranifera TaxID=201153 RepID=A0A8J6ASZ8_9EUKA|nr:hypothetical protein J8273_6390 [Carpediemonas membranifera]|eukprot:KAG9391625.1 hypothetical protein J8273_6390 [Carpediemonas membranifera]
MEENPVLKPVNSGSTCPHFVQLAYSMYAIDRDAYLSKVRTAFAQKGHKCSVEGCPKSFDLWLGINVDNIKLYCGGRTNDHANEHYLLTARQVATTGKFSESLYIGLDLGVIWCTSCGKPVERIHLAADGDAAALQLHSDLRAMIPTPAGRDRLVQRALSGEYKVAVPGTVGSGDEDDPTRTAGAESEPHTPSVRSRTNTLTSPEALETPRSKRQREKKERELAREKAKLEREKATRKKKAESKGLPFIEDEPPQDWNDSTNVISSVDFNTMLSRLTTGLGIPILMHTRRKTVKPVEVMLGANGDVKDPGSMVIFCGPEKEVKKARKKGDYSGSAKLTSMTVANIDRIYSGAITPSLEALKADPAKWPKGYVFDPGLVFSVFDGTNGALLDLECLPDGPPRGHWVGFMMTLKQREQQLREEGE